MGRRGRGLVVVAHVDGIDHCITPEFRQREHIADREAGGEGDGGTADHPGAAVIFEEVIVDRIFLAAVIEDPQRGAVRGHRNGGLPLVGGGGVVIDPYRRAPGGAAVGGDHQVDIRFVGPGRVVVVGHVEMAADRVDRHMGEFIAAESRVAGGALAEAGQGQVAVDAAGQPAGHGHCRGEAGTEVGRLAHLQSGAIIPESIDRMIRPDRHEGALLTGNDLYPQVGPEGVAMIGGAEHIDARSRTETARDQVDVAVAGAGKVVHRHPLLVFGRPARRAVDRRRPGHPVVIGAEHLDGADAEAEGGIVDPAGGFVAGQHRVAGIPAGIGGQGAPVGEGGPTIEGVGPAGELVRSAGVGSGVVEAQDHRIAEGQDGGFALGEIPGSAGAGIVIAQGVQGFR